MTDFEIVRDEAEYIRHRTVRVPADAELRFYVWYGGGWQAARAEVISVRCRRPREHSAWAIVYVIARGHLYNSDGQTGKREGSRMWDRDGVGLPERFAQEADRFLTELELERTTVMEPTEGVQQ